MPRVNTPAVANNGEALRCARAGLYADKDVVLAAVRSDGTALRYASDALRVDKEVVLAAVRNNGDALRYANAALYYDPLLLRLNAMPYRGKRRWRLVKLWWLMRSFAWWWEEDRGKAEYAARFDAAGEAVLVGAGARAAKRDFATMMA